MKNRREVVRWARGWIVRRGTARLEMSAILALSGVAAFGAAFVMHRVGVTSMGVRYASSAALAYVVFLALIGLWQRWLRSDDGDDDHADFDVGDGLDAVDLLDVATSLPRSSGAGTGASSASGDWEGEGGGFGGGGASGGWGGGGAVPAPVVAPPTPPVEAAADGGNVLGGLADGLGDAEEGAVVIVVVGLVLAAVVALCAAGYVVYMAPEFMAEVLADALISAGVYRRLRARDASWLASAFRGSYQPALVMILAFGMAGAALDWWAPGATRLDEVLSDSP